MDLGPYVESIHTNWRSQPGPGVTRPVRSPSVSPHHWTRRSGSALQDALAAATEEITTELAPGSVELRLRGRDPEFVVTLPPVRCSVEEPIGRRGASGRWPAAGVGRSDRGRRGHDVPDQPPHAGSSEGPDRAGGRQRRTVGQCLVGASRRSGARPNRYGTPSRTTCAERRSALLGLGALVRKEL